MTNPTEHRICIVCGAYLTRETDENDRVTGWEHSRGFLVDHPAVAVRPSEALGQIHPHCDFCGAQVSVEQVWTHPCEDFTDEATGSMMLGDWAACDACHERIMENDVPDGTVYRWLDENVDLVDLETWDELKLRMYRTHELFLANRTGEPPYRGLPKELVQ